MKTFTVKLETPTTGENCNALNTILQKVDAEQSEKDLIKRNNEAIIGNILIPYAKEVLESVTPTFNRLNLHVNDNEMKVSHHISEGAIRRSVSVNYRAKSESIDCSGAYLIKFNFILDRTLHPKYKINVFEPSVKVIVNSNNSFAGAKSFSEDFTTVENLIESQSDVFEEFYRESLKQK